MWTWAALALVVSAAGCASSSGARPEGAAAPVAPPPPPGLQVEKVREELAVTPWELAFSGVRGAEKASESVSVRNQSDLPVEIRGVSVIGEQAATFALAGLPALPLRLPPKGSLAVSVDFAPRADAPAGVHRALLRFQTGQDPADGPAADLSGLVMRSRLASDRPSLRQMLDALGFSVDLGAAGGASAAAGGESKGDEIRVPLFQRVNPSPVALNPVARFSAEGPVPFGFYAPADATSKLEPVAVIAAGQNQRLNPELEADGQMTFDPGEAPFGLWLKSGKATLRSEDAASTGAARPGMRVFPLCSRGGAPVPNAYLIAVDLTGNRGYQDLVFVLWNARPAAPPPAP